MNPANQQPLNEVDISITLRRIMAVRRLSVGDMAKAAGVSKSAMEKYLAGPSSPRLVALISLSQALSLSLDSLVFGESDPDYQLLYSIAFQQFTKVIFDLKTEPTEAQKFASLDAGSKEFADFARDVAYRRAVQVRVTFAAERQDEQHGKMRIAIG